MLVDFAPSDPKASVSRSVYTMSWDVASGALRQQNMDGGWQGQLVGTKLGGPIRLVSNYMLTFEPRCAMSSSSLGWLAASCTE